MGNTNKVVLETKELKIGYKIKRSVKIVAENINLKLDRGQLICLLGPNGAGKSTLIKTLSGILPSIDGCVNLCGKDLMKLSSLEIARQLSLVLTDRPEVGNMIVVDLVSLGRMPYTGLFGKLSVQDKEKVKWAIQVTGIEKFTNQKVHELSDGERQKVMIARAIAQDSSLIILDEPTAHLDLPNRVEIVRLLRKLSRETNKSIILSTHELDLALQAADKIWLMQPQGEIKTGTPEDLVINGTFEKVFQRDGLNFDKLTGTFKFHVPGIDKIELIGSGHLAFWTSRALEREGFKIEKDMNSARTIEIIEQDNGFHKWISAIEGEQKHHTSIENLIQTLTRNN